MYLKLHGHLCAISQRESNYWTLFTGHTTMEWTIKVVMCFQGKIWQLQRWYYWRTGSLIFRSECPVSPIFLHILCKTDQLRNYNKCDTLPFLNPSIRFRLSWILLEGGIWSGRANHLWAAAGRRRAVEQCLFSISTSIDQLQQKHGSLFWMFCCPKWTILCHWLVLPKLSHSYSCQAE